MRARALGPVIVCGALLLLTAPAAHAQQEGRTARRIDELLRVGMEDYDLLEMNAAKKRLGEALALVKRGKLEKSPVAARAHLRMGIVLGAGFSDADAALAEFTAALSVDPSLKLDPAYRSPALARIFEQARSKVVGEPSAAAAPEDRGLKHTPIEESPAGQPVLVAARVGADVKAAQVVLCYRSAAGTYAQAPMKTTNGVEYQG